MSSTDSDNPLAVEIQQEKAQAYFAACRKMVDCLEALKSFDHTQRTTRDDKEAALRAQIVEEAAEKVYFVLIQREAMGLGYPENFLKDYDVPPEVSARLGASPRKQVA